MDMLVVDSKKKIQQFIKFYKQQYLNNPQKQDSLSLLIKDLLMNKSEMCKSIDLEPLMVVENGEILMICILVYAYRMPDFLQISFFESSIYSPEGFRLILERAEALCKEKGTNKICASLNIHVNYGLGFLASNYDQKQSFGMAHNPEFYNNYFEDNGFSTIELVSYKKNIRNMNNLLSDNIKNKLNQKYNVRQADFKNFKQEIKLYTDINNQAFNDHLFYYLRTIDEDLELFKDLKFLLKEENLLFVEKEGKAIGFMLWYPEFNELMKVGKSIGLSTVIKNKLFPNKIKTFKIIEMGIVPEYQEKGPILALFEYCFQCTKGKFENFESSWILRDNKKSKSFGVKWSDGESKRYNAYIKEID